MKPPDGPIRRISLLGLVLLAAVGIVGCDRHAASQMPSPNTVASVPAQMPQEAVAKEPAAADANSPLPVPVSPEVGGGQPGSRDETAREKLQSGPDSAPPSSDAQPRPAALRPKADRGKTPDGVEKITFDDLILGMQADMVYRPWMLESETNGGRAKELDGKRVRLTGVMHGGVQSTKKNKEFVLLRNKECKFGPGGQADHLAKIFMKEGKTVSYTDETVHVEGTLRIKPTQGEDGNTWSIYEIEGAEMK